MKKKTNNLTVINKKDRLAKVTILKIFSLMIVDTLRDFRL
jgi:hypothetical protein